MRYAIVIEKAGDNYSAYAPDLPGCAATGATVQEAEAEIQAAIAFHLKGLRADGVPVPQPSSHVKYLASLPESRPFGFPRPRSPTFALSGRSGAAVAS
jgi:predicted RNase H-like HicB family nuclease